MNNTERSLFLARYIMLYKHDKIDLSAVIFAIQKQLNEVELNAIKKQNEKVIKMIDIKFDEL